MLLIFFCCFILLLLKRAGKCILFGNFRATKLCKMLCLKAVQKDKMKQKRKRKPKGSLRDRKIRKSKTND